jgi:hypothetical protein
VFRFNLAALSSQVIQTSTDLSADVSGPHVNGSPDLPSQDKFEKLFVAFAALSALIARSARLPRVYRAIRRFSRSRQHRSICHPPPRRVGHARMRRARTVHAHMAHGGARRSARASPGDDGSGDGPASLSPFSTSVHRREAAMSALAIRQLSQADLIALDNVDPVNSRADQSGGPRLIAAGVIARHPGRHPNLGRYNIALIDHPLFAYAYGVSAMPGDQLVIRDFGVINKTRHRGIDCRPDTGARVVIQNRRWFHADLSWPDVVYAYWEYRLFLAFGPEFFQVVADNPRVLDTHAAFSRSWPTTKFWLRKMCAQVLACTAEAEATIASAGFDAALARELEMAASKTAVARVERVNDLGVAEFVRRLQKKPSRSCNRDGFKFRPEEPRSTKLRRKPHAIGDRAGAPPRTSKRKASGVTTAARAADGHGSLAGPPIAADGHEGLAGAPIAADGHGSLAGAPIAADGHGSLAGPPIAADGHEGLAGPPIAADGHEGLAGAPIAAHGHGSLAGAPIAADGHEGLAGPPIAADGHGSLAGEPHRAHARPCATIRRQRPKRFAGSDRKAPQ